MTNRDYLMGLSNEKLAEVLERENSEMCDDMLCSNDCQKCIEKWLGMERKSKVEKGQIRQDDLGTCYLFFMVTDTECLIISEKGAIYRRLKSVVDTWVIRNDISIDEFAERIFNSFGSTGE